ncbi:MULTISPECIES: CotO family spore coat protein [unclassified Virgibacillus]|uniref:CotO family spore coat protein n=1 Tax=unclassified Virgibacillus TaxID=2620237 RepID=UPI0024DEE383|nr:CotO family spore coat protein [Virgibacillus sp. LDC-1]
MGEERYAKNPLLYINQPKVVKPEARMQHQYVTPKKERKTVQPISIPSSPNTKEIEKQRNTEPKPVRKRPALGNVTKPQQTEEKETNTAAVEHVEEDIESESDSDPHVEGYEQNKKFKEMTLKERIEYFARTPSHIPKMRCELKTEEKTYRGVITDFDGESITMRTGRRTQTITIPFEAAQQVRMLGF